MATEKANYSTDILHSTRFPFTNGSHFLKPAHYAGNALINTILNGFLGFSIGATILLNGVILIAYVREQSLRTSFNALIVNLSIAELLFAGTGMPGNFIRGLYGYFPYAPGICTFFLYCMNIFGTAVRYGHVLITVNRLWAVTYPVHYRRHLSMQFTYYTIGVMWIVANMVFLPVLIPGRIWAKVNDTQCVINMDFQPTAGSIVEIVRFVTTEMAVIGLSGFVLYKIHTRRKVGMQLAAITLSLASKHDTVSQSKRPDGMNKDSVGAARSKQSRGKRTQSAHNRVLGYLVLAVIICWTPNSVYWLLVTLRQYWNPTFLAVQNFALYANSWISPALCYIALKDFRTVINRMFSFNAC